MELYNDRYVWAGHTPTELLEVGNIITAGRWLWSDMDIRGLGRIAEIRDHSIVVYHPDHDESDPAWKRIIPIESDVWELWSIEDSEMTLNEAAAELELEPGTLRRQIHQGSISATKRGRDWFVTRSEVDRYRREVRRVDSVSQRC